MTGRTTRGRELNMEVNMEGKRKGTMHTYSLLECPSYINARNKKESWREVVTEQMNKE